MSQWLVRAAEERDIKHVAAFAQALAAHEGMPPSLFTAENVRRDGMGEKKHFTCAVIEPEAVRSEQAPIGMAIYYPGYDVATASRGTHLADLFVLESWRGQGAGRALLGHVARETLAAGGVWISWTVMRKNREALGFYRKLEASMVDVDFMALGKAGLVRVGSRTSEV